MDQVREESSAKRSLTVSMSNGKINCLGEADDLFEKLTSWREESHQQISNIINSHNSSIRNGIHNMAEEICGLQAKLSVMEKERTVLLETVDHLNGEIRQLNAKFQSQPKPEELNQIIPEDINWYEEISKTTQEEQESTSFTDKHDRTEARTDTSKANPPMNEIATKIQIARKDADQLRSNKTNLRRPKTTSNLDTHVCPECKFEFSTNENMRIHLKNIHSISEEMANTSNVEGSNDRTDHNKSDSMTTYRTYRVNELSINHGKDERKMCKLCPFQTAYNPSMIRHVKAVHHKIKDHVCDDCGYKASQKVTLINHRISVHKIGEKRFSCDKCPFKALSSSHLNRHIKVVHGNNIDHDCEECGYTASNKVELSNHIFSFHKMGVKKSKCELCPYETYSKQTLRNHFKTFHL